MEENSTEQRWKEKRKHRSVLAWSYRYPHKTHAQTQHPLCYAGAVKVVVRELQVPSSICRCGTYRKRDKAPTSRRKDRGSSEVQSTEQFISLLAFYSTLSKSRVKPEPPRYESITPYKGG